MDATQKLVEKLVERRMQNTGESQEVATANVLAAFEKLKRNEGLWVLILIVGAESTVVLTGFSHFTHAEFATSPDSSTGEIRSGG